MAQKISKPHATGGGIAPYVGPHPVLSTGLIFVAYMIISVLVGLAAKALLPDFQPDYLVLIVLSILLAITLTIVRWWHETGFNMPSAWRSLPLAWVPVVIVLGLPFLQGVKTSDWNTFLYLLVGYALTGFMEEGLMRGIIMRVLNPRPTRSVVISAAFFGLMHVGNLLYRNPAIVMAQMVGAFVDGIGLARSACARIPSGSW